MREYSLDIGSVSLKIAEFDAGKLKKTEYIKHLGNPFKILHGFLKDLDRGARLALTGSFPDDLARTIGAVRINEVEAAASGVLHFLPHVRSIIEIGGEDSKLISVDGGITDFSSNTMCAAGAGIFLDQQAKRLRIAVEDLGDVAMQSKNPARIAGRCSVFAKSDMIHLQQIGTPTVDLIAGLCLALARNFRSAIVRGKTIQLPAAFIGGVAANSGMSRALQEMLEIEPKEFLVPEFHRVIGAIGAAFVARQKGWPEEFKGVKVLEDWLNRPRTISRLPPLDGRKKWQPVFSANLPQKMTRAYLGVDVGSISTNLVLIDESGKVIGRQYLWTRGRPLEVVVEGLKDLQQELGDRVDIVGAGTTGSGRYLVGAFIGADIIKNEITAQARAAIEIDPAVDTIFEIGGQDSKYISIDNRTIVDFEMNKICAAGTGSFLEEQAQVLGVKLEEFGDQALDAASPINLGERCTVFIGSEVIYHQRNHAEHENLLAGLGYSTVFNYLNRVVGNKRIGSRIFFQGGVAANKAVISAFEEVLQKKVTVPPNHDVTGAIGIALLARDSGNGATRFKGFQLSDKPYKSISFACRHCSNECEVNRITVDGEKPIFYGGRCERYEEKEKKTDTQIPDLFSLRNEIFFAQDKDQEHEKAAGIPIGIPRTLVVYELFPFFYRFLTLLGFAPVLSDETTKKVVAAGSEVSVADTCFPVKSALGHIRTLAASGIDKFFLPSVISMPPNDPGFTRTFVCPYVQTIPYLSRAVLGDKLKIFSPYLYFDRGKDGIQESLVEFGKRFGKSEREVRNAIAGAIEYQSTVQKKMEQAGKEALRKIDDLAFVVISRPYNGYDRGLNLDLPKKIRNLGVLPIPLDMIGLDYESITEDFYNMYWHYGQRILAAAAAICKNEKLFAVYLSNFSCGPDSFLTSFFREKLVGKPMLLIEVDEHSGDAGMITRLEAFHDSIKGAQRKGYSRKIPPKSQLNEERTVYIPDMYDSARVLASAMRCAGFSAEVMDPPDENSVAIGRQYTTGRECLPAIITAGDMIKKIRSSSFDAKRGAFFMAQGSGPCRFGQYYKLHRMILDDFGFKDVPIYAPNQGPSLFDDLGPAGLKFLFSVWDGVVAVDALDARARKIRPYEANAGETDSIYADALDEVCRCVEKGKGVIPVLKLVRKRLDAVRTRPADKPKVGIVGEIYIRSQKFSNGNLIKRLEELGCEVAMPSIAEWFLYTNYTRIMNCTWFREHRRKIFSKLFNEYMTRRQAYIYKIMGLEKETGISQLLRIADKYVHRSFEGETVLSVAKTLEYIEKGLSGVVNVMPFTCMPGNIVTTICKAIKDRHQEFPLLVLSYDGVANTLDAMRMETFVSQAGAFGHKNQK